MDGPVVERRELLERLREEVLVGRGDPLEDTRSCPIHRIKSNQAEQRLHEVVRSTYFRQLLSPGLTVAKANLVPLHLGTELELKVQVRGEMVRLISHAMNLDDLLQREGGCFQ